MCQRPATGVEQSQPSNPGMHAQQPVVLSHRPPLWHTGHDATLQPMPCQGGLHTHRPLAASHVPRGAVHSATHVRRSQRGPNHGGSHSHACVCRLHEPCAPQPAAHTANEQSSPSHPASHLHRPVLDSVVPCTQPCGAPTPGENCQSSVSALPPARVPSSQSRPLASQLGGPAALAHASSAGHFCGASRAAAAGTCRPSRSHAAWLLLKSHTASGSAVLSEVAARAVDSHAILAARAPHAASGGSGSE